MTSPRCGAGSGADHRCNGIGTYSGTVSINNALTLTDHMAEPF